MPKVSLDTVFDGVKPFAEFAVTSDFESDLPTEDTFAAANVSALYNITQYELSGLSFSNWADLSVRSLYNIGSSFGIEAYQMESVGDFANQLLTLWRQPPGTTGTDIIEGTLISALDLSMSAIGQIPIVGWVVQIAYELAMMIYDAVKMFKDSKKDVPIKALAYSSGRDNDMVKRALKFTNAVDWTEVFLPATSPSSFKSKSISFGNDDDGVNLLGYLVMPDQHEILGGLGVLPGLPKVFDNFQLPHWYKESKTPLPGESPSGWPGTSSGQDTPFCRVGWYSGNKHIQANLCKNIGEFQPTMQQFGYNLWSMVRTNGANAFKIAQNYTAGHWEDYFGALVEYIENQAANSGDNNARQRAYDTGMSSSVGWYNPYTGDYYAFGEIGNVPGFAKYLQDEGDRNGAFIKNPLRAGGAPPENTYLVTYGALVKFLLNGQLRACYQNFLKTITVAYVNESFPAIGGPVVAPSFKQRWFDNRKLLLKSSAVHDVELDLIPDNEYAAAVSQAQKLGGFQITAAPIPGIIGDIAPPPDYPEYPHPPPLVPPGRGRGGKGAGAGLAIAAIAGLILLGRRR